MDLREEKNAWKICLQSMLVSSCTPAEAWWLIEHCNLLFFLDTEVRAHMEDLSMHLNVAIHAAYNGSSEFPKRSLLQSECVPMKTLKEAAKRQNNSPKPYNMSRGDIPGYGSFSKYYDKANRLHFDLNATGHWAITHHRQLVFIQKLCGAYTAAELAPAYNCLFIIWYT